MPKEVPECTIPNFLNVDTTNQVSKDVSEMLIDNFFDENIASNFVKEFWISILDFFNITSFDHTNILNFIRKIVWDSNVLVKSPNDFEISSEWLSIISDNFNSAKEIYNKVFFRSVPKNLYPSTNWNPFKFKDTNHLIQFVSWKTKSWSDMSPAFRQTVCNLVKLSILSYLIDSSWVVEKAQEWYDLSRDKYFCDNDKYFNYVDSNDDSNSKDWDYPCINKYRTNPQEHGLATPVVEVDIIGRPKTKESVLLKMASQYDYGTAESIKDLVWFKWEVKSKKDALFLADYIFNTFYDANNITTFFKDKWIFDISYYEENKGMFSKGFVEYFDNLIASGKLKDQKERTWAWYEDMKFIWLVEWQAWKKYEIEFQIVIVDNQNEAWYNAHPIMSTLRVLESMIRLQWYISTNYAKKLIINTLKKYTDIFPGTDPNEQSDKVLDEFINNRWLSYLSLSWWRWKPPNNVITKKSDFIRIAKAWIIPKDSTIFTKLGDDSSVKPYTYEQIIKYTN